MFNPEIHTKEHLLKNRELLIQLARSDELFHKSELAQDVDILGVCDHNGECVAVHIINEQYGLMPGSRWIDSPAAQSEEVLMIRSGRLNYELVYYITRVNGWLQTPIAHDPKILSYQGAVGFSVLHSACFAVIAEQLTAEWNPGLTIKQLIVDRMILKGVPVNTHGLAFASDEQSKMTIYALQQMESIQHTKAKLLVAAALYSTLHHIGAYNKYTSHDAESHELSKTTVQSWIDACSSDMTNSEVITLLERSEDFWPVRNIFEKKVAHEIFAAVDVPPTLTENTPLVEMPKFY